jgi:hypothetical protein
LRADANVSLAEERVSSVALYRELIRTSSDDRVKLLARKRLDDLFGLDAPPRAPVDGDGNTVPGQTINISNVRAALGDEKGRQMLAELAEYSAGLPSEADLGLPVYGLHELPADPLAERMRGGAPHGPDGPA